jgi:hypothetical protein
MPKKSSPPVIPPDVEAAGPRAIASFREMIKDGVSVRMAEMLACKQAPGSRIGPFGAIKPGVGPTAAGDREIKWLGRE